MNHRTKHKSSQTGSTNMTMSSVYFSGLSSHQMRIQYLWNLLEWRIWSWACSWQMCSNYIRQSCQHVQESRNVSNPLWKPCPVELRLSWKLRRGCGGWDGVLLSISMVRHSYLWYHFLSHSNHLKIKGVTEPFPIDLFLVLEVLLEIRIHHLFNYFSISLWYFIVWIIWLLSQSF